MTNTSNMIYPELDEKVSKETQIEFRCSTISGKYYITTDLELAGKGITITGDGSDHKRGKKTYQVTERVMNKLEKEYVCTYIALL